MACVHRSLGAAANDRIRIVACCTSNTGATQQPAHNGAGSTGALRLCRTFVDVLPVCFQKANLEKHKQALLRGKIEHVVDHRIGQTLDFLSKELVRCR